MSIVINTPNSRIGRRLATTLMNAGQGLVVIGRDEKKVEPLTKRGARLVRGSFDEPAVLEAALEGASAIFWLTPPPARPDAREWAVNAARAAAAAAREHGLERAVVLSAVGARTMGAHPAGALGEVEDAFEAQLPNVISLRPAFFMESLFLQQAGALAKAGAVFANVPGKKRFPMVAAADVADKAASWLLAPGWSGHCHIGVHGPQDLTYEEAVSIVADALGRPVRYAEISREEARANLARAGAPPFLAEVVAELYAALGDGRMDPAEPRTPETTTATTLAIFAREVLAPAAGA